MADISGTTKNASGALAARVVRVHRKSDGVVVGTMLSNASTGVYSLTALDTSKHYAIAFDTEDFDPDWSNCVLAMHMADTGLSDEMAHTVTKVGGASRVSDGGAFGGYAAGFDGTGDWLTLYDSAEWSFGTGTFKIRTRVKFDAANPDYQTIVGQFADTSNWWFLRKEEAANNKLSIYFRVGGTVMANYIMTSDWSGLTAGTYYDIEIGRLGTSMYLLIDGVIQALTATVPVGTNDVGDISSPLYIGSDGTYSFRGNINELQIYKGTSPHTSDFTPRASAFINCVGNGTENAQIFDNITPL